VAQPDLKFDTGRVCANLHRIGTGEIDRR